MKQKVATPRIVGKGGAPCGNSLGDWLESLSPSGTTATRWSIVILVSSIAGTGPDRGSLAWEKERTSLLRQTGWAWNCAWVIPWSPFETRRARFAGIKFVLYPDFSATSLLRRGYRY